MKKYLFSLAAIMISVAFIYPSVSSAADTWSFGLGQNGFSAGYVGQTTSFGLNSNGDFSVGSGKKGGVAGLGALFGGAAGGLGGMFYNAGGGWSLANLAGFGLPAASITQIIRGLLMWLLVIFGLLGIIGFVISGIMYILSRGDDGQMEKAKEAMLYSIMGIVVGLMGIVIIQAIDMALRGLASF